MTYEPQEKNACACAPTPSEPMNFVDRSIATYKALVETNDILDKIANLIEGECHTASTGESPMCLNQNIDANYYWAQVVRNRIESLACLLGVKN